MNKFYPLTLEEFEQLDKTISEIGAYLPENKAPYIWDTFNRLRDVTEVRPCTCASSGHHWKRAMDYLYNWVKDRK
jgi:hypothetical protein